MDFTNLKNFMDHMAADRTPGNAVEVYLGGEKVFQYEAGYADLENKIPLTGNEMYNIYSCSKVTTHLFLIGSYTFDKIFGPVPFCNDITELSDVLYHI